MQLRAGQRAAPEAHPGDEVLYVLKGRLHVFLPKGSDTITGTTATGQWSSRLRWRRATAESGGTGWPRPPPLRAREGNSTGPGCATHRVRCGAITSKSWVRWPSLSGWVSSEDSATCPVWSDRSTAC